MKMETAKKKQVERCPECGKKLVEGSSYKMSCPTIGCPVHNYDGDARGWEFTEEEKEYLGIG